MLKSNQTSKYETHCFIQEQPQESEKPVEKKVKVKESKRS